MLEAIYTWSVMDGWGVYVWSAYGLVIASLGGVGLYTWHHYQRSLEK